MIFIARANGLLMEEEYDANKSENKPKILFFPSKNYKFKMVEYTKEDLKYLKEEWESTPHLLSGDAYAASFKKRTHIERDDRYPKNYIDAIVNLKNEINLNAYDFIVLDIDNHNYKLFKGNNIDVTYIDIDDSCRDLIVGKLYRMNYDNKNKSYENILNAYTTCWSVKDVYNSISKFKKEYPDSVYTVSGRNLLSDNYGFLEIIKNNKIYKNERKSLYSTMSTFRFNFENVETGKPDSIDFCAHHAPEAYELFTNWVINELENSVKDVSVDIVFDEDDAKEYCENYFYDESLVKMSAGQLCTFPDINV